MRCTYTVLDVFFISSSDADDADSSYTATTTAADFFFPKNKNKTSNVNVLTGELLLFSGDHSK